MTKYHWLLEDEVANSPFCPVVNITSADTCPVYGYENIMRGFDGRLWFLFEFYVEGFVEDERKVL
jgi:hypothetical protein